jgi:hypothetical protein
MASSESLTTNPHLFNCRTFAINWLPGYVMAAPMLLGCVWLVRIGASRRLRAAAVWLAGLLAYLFLVLGPKYLDRDSGVLGKFCLFRPSSPVELLWLILALAYAAEVAGRRAWLLRATVVAAIGSLFLYVQGGRLMREIDASKAVEAQQALLVAAVTRLTVPGDVVLIDPDVEMQWLDFERRTGRPRSVIWKFAPTNDAELIAWYRRIGRGWAIFELGCGVPAGAPAYHAGISVPICRRLRFGSVPPRSMGIAAADTRRRLMRRRQARSCCYGSTIICPYIHGCGVQM